MDSYNIVTASLDDLECRVENYLENKACLIYWHNRVNSMMYLTTEDQTIYKKELKNIRDNVNKGGWKQVKAGENFIIGSKTLYTLLAEIDENDICPAYFLLKRRDLGEDMYWVPYFFTSEKSRDAALEWISKNTNNSVTATPQDEEHLSAKKKEAKM